MPPFRYVSVLLIFMAVNGCAVRTISSGTYREYAGPQTVLFEGTTISFYKGTSFKYNFWSDMYSESKYGTGKYRLSNQRLLLIFDGQPAPKSYLQEKATGSFAADTVTYTLSVRVSQDDKYEPLPGATVTIHKASGELITGATVDTIGFARLKIARTVKPYLLRVSYIGVDHLEQILPESDAEIDVYLHWAMGTTYATGHKMQFDIIKISEDELILKKYDRRIALVAERK